MLEEKRPRRSLWCLRLSVRTVSTSLNSWVASLSRDRRLSTTVWEWSWLCLFSSLLREERRCRSAMAELRAWMSCLMMPVSSSTSCAGSSNMDVRLAS